jgi:hypothetical protein
MEEQIKKERERCIDEEYDYKGFHFQRMYRDQLWYVTWDNKIVNWSQYRHDLESWIDQISE